MDFLSPLQNFPDKIGQQPTFSFLGSDPLHQSDLPLFIKFTDLDDLLVVVVLRLTNGARPTSLA